MAKATIICAGKNGWRRELEIDGHEVSHRDPDFPAGVEGPEFGYLTRFAVFEFPRNSTEMLRRVELDRTVRHFAEHFATYDTVDRLMEEMVGQGFDVDLVHEAESLSTIAFGRTFFERHGVQYASTVIRARRDGRVEADVPLMSLPAYARARALAVQLRTTMSREHFQALCLYNAESHAILKALEAGGDKLDLSKMTMYPCVVPERGVSNRTMDAAIAVLNDLTARKGPVREKAWWKIW